VRREKMNEIRIPFLTKSLFPELEFAESDYNNNVINGALTF